MKKIISLALAAMMLLSLAACGKQAAEPEFNAVKDRVVAAVATSADMAGKDADYIKNMIGVDTASYTDALVMSTNVGTSRDEYGVFKCADEAAAEKVKAAVEAYIAQCIENMMGYTPEELPKLENAAVSSEGSYVFYAVLGDADRQSAVSAFEGCFTEG